METGYRDVTQLNRNELDELKEAYYDELLCSDEDILQDEVGNYMNWQDIPDDVIFEHYTGINFVEEDFWCNVK